MKLSRKQYWQENFKIQPVNITLVIVLVAIFIWEMLVSYSPTISVNVLYHAGAQYGPAILEQHQWWRLLAAGFLHITPTHLIFNLVVLYFIGKLLEWQIGHVRFACLFFGAVLIGNLASLAFGDMRGISAGASGGIYGLFGAVIGIGILDRFHDFWKREATTIGILVVISFLMSFTRDGVDVYAHLGGIMMGLIASPLLISSRCQTGSFKVTWWGKSMSAIGVLLLAGGLLYIALQRGV
ncbi:rhomboid family intramembrane serine protease [Weissella diestrammenae]|uniref:Rhomboid family intramembrane serine protease n=1 Tax=Weissella diestrammenae TaxID=1162633 RepID=A0A7G9T3T9_9LACO|nr:rhomboid family intramembrane serine protease [Weissella diestrammenae]MCM0582750.1 rhomboid family intramembrane serine protease [Weissella diestrammenae]QNN74764.1 rhomboid family intramembrane serine protease [Weissella diestrammenae]